MGIGKIMKKVLNEFKLFFEKLSKSIQNFNSQSAERRKDKISAIKDEKEFLKEKIELEKLKNQLRKQNQHSQDESGFNFEGFGKSQAKEFEIPRIEIKEELKGGWF